MGAHGTHFLDHPTFPFPTNGGASYRGAGAGGDDDDIQPLYHSMLISSSSSSLESSLLGTNAATVGGILGGMGNVMGHDGVLRVQCLCGGRHLPRNSSKGMASWRSHVSTKRHQNWLKSQGPVGTV